MMLCNNNIVASVIGVVVCVDEYANICDFVCVTPFASNNVWFQSSCWTAGSFMFVNTALMS